MAPKGKSKRATAKVVPKQQAASKAKAKVTPPKKAKPVDALPEESSDKKRKFRVDNYEAADNAIQDRLLPFYSHQLLAGATNSKGQTIQDVVADQINANRASKRRLRTGFWTAVIDDFDLNADVFDMLPDPDEGQGYRKSIDEKLAIAHSTNTKVRSTDPIVTFLQETDDLEYVELYGIMNASAESKVITKANHHRIMLAVIKYIARTRAHLKFPGMWKAISAIADSIVTTAFEASSLPTLNWCKSYRLVMLLWMSLDQYDAVLKALESNSDPAPTVLTGILKSCRLASVMFSDAEGRLEVVRFVDSTNKQLNNLEFHDFAEDEVTNFTNLMNNDVKVLTDLGHDDFEDVDILYNIIYLGGETLKLGAGTLTQAWKRRYEARKRVAAINYGSLKPTKYEKLLFQIGSIPRAPMACAPPPALLEDAANFREVLGKHLEEETTFKGMINVMTANLADYKEADPWSELDFEFLVQHAERLGTVAIQGKTLEALPSDPKSLTYEKSLLALHAIKVLPLCVATRGMTSDVQGIINYVTNLSEGTGPTHAEVDKAKPFYKQCFERLQFFYEPDFDLPVVVADRRGKAAVLAQYKIIEDKMAHDVATDPDDIRSLRAFTWLMPEASNKITQEWLGRALEMHAATHYKSLADGKLPAKGAKKKALTDDGEDAASKGSANASSSSRAAASAATIQPTDAAKDTTMPNMRKFFLGKKKKASE